MASITIRNLDESTKTRLRVCAHAASATRNSVAFEDCEVELVNPWLA